MSCSFWYFFFVIKVFFCFIYWQKPYLSTWNFLFFGNSYFFAVHRKCQIVQKLWISNIVQIVQYSTYVYLESWLHIFYVELQNAKMSRVLILLKNINNKLCSTQKHTLHKNWSRLFNLHIRFGRNSISQRTWQQKNLFYYLYLCKYMQSLQHQWYVC